jgi:alpha-D-ribose 1-methylphosphonate 5-triphosphate synthase subunit PhnG
MTTVFPDHVSHFSRYVHVPFTPAGYTNKARMQYDNDYVLCECDLGPLSALVVQLETKHQVAIVKEPSVCLTMIRTEDSLEKQQFYLGEALTTECEVAVDGNPGYGVCLGEEPVRCYSIAVVDALLRDGGSAEVASFLDHHRSLIAEREQREFNLTLRTQVDFKLMEEE